LAFLVRDYWFWFILQVDATEPYFASRCDRTLISEDDFG
jgi:hypothetical protein